MTEQGPKHAANKAGTEQQHSDSAEDLQPREDESGGVKGGSLSWGRGAGGGGGAGKV